MKPPPRKRVKRDAAFKTERGPHCKLVCNWERAEERKLLSGLKALLKADGTRGDLDCASLKGHVPTRSAAEIESVIEKLKSKIISSVCAKVENERREDRKARKPIEMWRHLASAVVGTLEEPISTAFSQMLLVSSTEPCTLRNCDPPQTGSPPTDQQRLLHYTVPMRPVLHTPVQGEPTGINANRPLPVSQPPEPTMGPAKRPVAPSQAVGVANNTAPPPKQQSSTAAGTPVLDGASSCQTSEGVSASTHRHTQTAPVRSAAATAAATPLRPTSDSSLSAPPAAASSSVPAHTTPSSPPCLPKFGPTGQNISCRPRGLGVQSIVDFEKIYQYLGVLHQPSPGCKLTVMESAIVLDLLMSLPEELPLLDCKNLQKHLVQVYQTLSVSADSKMVKELLKNLKGAGESERPTAGSEDGPRAPEDGPRAPEDGPRAPEDGPRAPEARPQQGGHSGGTGPKAPEPQDPHSHSPGDADTHSQCEDKDLVGLCPPLNPFMVPLKLLMRRSSATK